MFDTKNMFSILFDELWASLESVRTSADMSALWCGHVRTMVYSQLSDGFRMTPNTFQMIIIQFLGGQGSVGTLGMMFFTKLYSRCGHVRTLVRTRPYFSADPSVLWCGPVRTLVRTRPHLVEFRTKTAP